MSYPTRDFLGYGANPPDPCWPNDARIAVQFVINYEEGGENCILNGDPASETFLSEIIGAKAYEGVRHMSMESMYEYGSRAGFWRLHRLFTQLHWPVTVYGVATALEKNPQVVQAMLDADWEIACHGLKWIDHQFMDEAEERRQILAAIDLHEKITGQPPLGWYTGRDSPNTRKIIKELGTMRYHSDSYADDLPYWDTEDSSNQLIIPYTLETNDMRFAAAQGFNSGEQFFTYLKDAFDCLYEEGAHSPKMLNIGLHCRIVGRPARFMALKRFCEYVKNHEQVWVCKRIDIAEHWHANHTPA